jgi:hypothetical protein
MVSSNSVLRKAVIALYCFILRSKYAATVRRNRIDSKTRVTAYMLRLLSGCLSLYI